jgi:subtilase family serine protease
MGEMPFFSVISELSSPRAITLEAFMRVISRTTAAAATLLTAAALATVGYSAKAAPASPGAAPAISRVCAAAKPGTASCLSYVRSGAQPGSDVRPNAAAPSGLNPADLRSAYKITSAGSAGQTIAIVDAFNDPTAEADLGVYRSQFGLPACTTANGCFKKVNQTGGSSLPSTDAGWALEISLDLDMASAICSNCHILLVEASSASFANLGAAENYAAAHANVVSNSYGGSDSSDANFGSFYNHPGVAITVSSGDSGFGVEYPASSHFVTAVGGTTLTRSSAARGWTESAWNGSGSGCSRFNTALTGAAGAGTGCSRRAVADVSAVADPNTGVSVFDSTPLQGSSGWFVVGGTSASAPIIAGVYGLAGNAASIDNNFPYSHKSGLFDVTTGSNGSCSPSQLCRARAGWDGPTGLGTPNGTSAF